MADTVSTTYGALLLGSSLAYSLTGALCFQCALYFKLYREDRSVIKYLVSSVWVLDLIHSGFVCAALVHYFLQHFGEPDAVDRIHWSIAFSVLVTAIQTFFVHCFFLQRILKSSGGNWYITVPIMCMTFGRLLAASVSTSEMIRVKMFAAFAQPYPGWIFTLGLSLSSAADILIAGCLCYFLRNLRDLTGSAIMIQAIDVLIRHTLETGSLTCIATTISLITWVSMSNNLVFLGLHFVISKLYANSLLAHLNTRQELRSLRLRNNRTWMRPAVPTFAKPRTQRSVDNDFDDVDSSYGNPPSKSRQVEVNIERTVELTVSSGFGQVLDQPTVQTKSSIV